RADKYARSRGRSCIAPRRRGRPPEGFRRSHRKSGGDGRSSAACPQGGGRGCGLMWTNCSSFAPFAHGHVWHAGFFTTSAAVEQISRLCVTGGSDARGGRSPIFPIEFWFSATL